MEKKRKIIVIIIIGLLIVLVGIGGFLFIDYQSEEVDKNTDFINDKGSADLDSNAPMVEGEKVYSNKEEVIKAINSEFLFGEGKASFSHSEDDCWYFSASTGTNYIYCLSDPVIREIY